MVAAGSGDGFQFSSEDPLLDGGVADADGGGGFARGEEGVGGLHGGWYPWWVDLLRVSGRRVDQTALKNQNRIKALSVSV